jgi:hypothetical protein
MFLQIKRVGKLCLYFLVIGGPGVFPGCSPYKTQWQEPAKSATKVVAYKNSRTRRMLGDYGRYINYTGHMDIPPTIDQLKKLHINTYFYLIHHSSASWRHLLKVFMPAAQKAGIDVFVYLASPAASLGSKDPSPYGPDYVHWAQVIAHLSLKYSHLKGWAIDDFSWCLHTFTPSYVKKMVQAAHKINPSLSFLPVVSWYPATCPCFHRKYGPYVDGIIFPYVGFYDLSILPHRLDQITKIWPSQSVVLMVYATKHSGVLNPPPPSYVRKALQIGLNYRKHGKLAGVMTYKLKKDPHKTTCENSTHNVLQFGVAYGIPTKKGDYVEASQTTKVDPNANQYTISFWMKDDRHQSNPKDFHMKQFLVNGQVVWYRDVTKDGEKRYKVSLDLTKYLRGKSSATIAFRLYEKRGVGNYTVEVTFGAIRAHGFHVVNSNCSDWTFKSTGPHVHRMHQCHECDPHRQQKMFDAVKKLYGAWSEK